MAPGLTLTLATNSTFQDDDRINLSIGLVFPLGRRLIVRTLRVRRLDLGETMVDKFPSEMIHNPIQRGSRFRELISHQVAGGLLRGDASYM